MDCSFSDAICRTTYHCTLYRKGLNPEIFSSQTFRIRNNKSIFFKRVTTVSLAIRYDGNKVVGASIYSRRDKNQFFNANKIFSAADDSMFNFLNLQAELLLSLSAENQLSFGQRAKAFATKTLKRSPASSATIIELSISEVTLMMFYQGRCYAL